MMNVLASPAEVFDEVKASRSCAANWLVPAFILVLVGWVGVWLIFSQPTIQQQLNDMTSKAIEKQIQKSGQSTPPTDAQMQSAEKVASTIAKVGAIAGPPIAAFVSPFWWGLILWLVGAKIFKGNFSFMKAVEVAGLGNVVAILAGVIGTLLILTFSNLFASPSLALLVKDYDPNNPTHAAMTAFDLMYFWLLGVRSVGLARLSGVSFGKAAAWVFGLWLGWTALKLAAGFAIRAATGN